MEGVELLRRSKNKNQLQLELPPIYSVFTDNYEIGRDAFKIKYFNFNGDLIQLTSITYFGVDYENPLSHFFNGSEIEGEIKKYSDKVDDYHKQGFIKIGLFDINDSILLGISEGNIDTIWKLNGDWGDNRPYKEKIADNVFQFISCLKEVIIKMNLIVRRIDKSQLYLNWGDEFWRIREDQPA